MLPNKNLTPPQRSQARSYCESVPSETQWFRQTFLIDHVIREQPTDR